VSERNYLIKVLGLSAIPRLTTFGLTLVSLPLMIRALGADRYGIMVYLGSIMSMLELLVGFGVASAAGKGIASCRAIRKHRLSYELGRWARLQFAVAVASILPVIGIGYVVVVRGESQEIGPGLFLTVAATLFVSVLVTFVRSVLQSMLAFKTIAGLDTIESTVRSTGWLVVAWLFPTVLGLAVAGFITSCVAGLLGVAFLSLTIRKHGLSPHETSLPNSDTLKLPLKHMLLESLSFVGLTLGTRAYQTLPIVLLRHLLGFELVGIIGAFSKVIEVLTLPFTVIGNALMVRAQEIRNRGAEIVNRYWDMLLRFCVLAMVAAWGFWFVAHEVAVLLLPESSLASRLFSIMTALIWLRAVSDLFAPGSDYVGGLRSRVTFLLLCAVLQLPLIWVATRMFGEAGAITAMVVSYALMVGGYVVIGRRVFLSATVYRPSRDIVLAFFVVLASGVVTSLIASSAPTGMIIYIAMLVVGFLSIPLLRREYGSGKFLRFELG